MILAGLGFLLAILWMDLIFDVQVLRHRRDPGDLPETVLASIAGYYRRATTDAHPMGHLVGLAMAVTIVALVVDLVRGGSSDWPDLVSLALLAPCVGLGAARTYPAAVRLGSRRDSPAEQSRLARAICRDHLLCLAVVAPLLAFRIALATVRPGPLP